LQLKDATIADLGRCEYIKSTKNETIIVGGSGEKADIDMRIAELKASINDEEMEFDRTKLEERLARLTSGVAVIRVGGSTEVEMKERLERVKDSIKATVAAVKQGIVPGGEIIFLIAREKLDKSDVAQNIIYKALYEPFKKLLNNAALNDGEWYEKLKSAKKNSGVNVTTGEIEDMVAKGIIDPVLVPLSALKNAVSIALMLSSTGHIINQKDIDKK
jgi:chaperonin GroEL